MSTIHLSPAREETTNQLKDFKVEIIKEINSLEVKLANTKADLIKWMFIFWIGQIAVIAGILAWFLYGK